jgi:hypothetical protein
MMPDAELPIVGERVAKETSVVGGAREGYRLMMGFGIDNSLYMVAETSRFGVEINSVKIVSN